MNSTAYVWPQGEEIVFVRPPVEEYHGKLDYFYDPKLFPELSILKENWKAIRDEILDYESRKGELKGMSAYTVPDTAGGQWTVKYLTSFMMHYHKNREEFPFICSIIDQIPNAVFACISVLPPNSEIKPHYGDTNGIVRAHLGLVVPAAYPTIAIRVGDEERGWAEGELLSFINVQRHSVWNRSDKRRYVLMVDFVPDPLKHRQVEICARGLGSQTFNIFYHKFWLVRKMPIFMHDAMCAVFALVWRMLLPVQRKFKFLSPPATGA